MTMLAKDYASDNTTSTLRPGSARTTPSEKRPLFQQAAFAPPTEQQQQQQPIRRRSGGGDSDLLLAHTNRIRTAGRIGTQRYVSPCKVFVGNLPFGLTDGAVLKEWVATEVMGYPHSHYLIHECKIIVDWKTGKSKGYGFIVFTEPIYASVCIDKFQTQGIQLQGRTVTASQGIKKETATVLLQSQQRRRRYQDEPLRTDEDAIAAGVEEALDPDAKLDPGVTGDEPSPRKVGKNPKKNEVELDPIELSVLRRLDPDLLPSQEYPAPSGQDTDPSLLDEVTDDDLLLDDDTDLGEWLDKPDDVIDDITTPALLNREQRRKNEAELKRRTKKKAKKGFGS
jgi:RNA recognition motif. (a.k.a. RRM, RBD, or RNP domain)